MHLGSSASEATLLISLFVSRPWKKQQCRLKRWEFIIEGENGLAVKEVDAWVGRE